MVLSTLVAISGAAAAVSNADLIRFLVFGSGQRGPDLSEREWAALDFFEEAVPELTRDAQLANGGYSVHLTLPAQQLETAKAAPDSLTRLGAAFGSGARALSDREILSRMARLAHERSDVPSVCLTHTIGPGKTVELASGQTLRARALRLHFRPSC